MGKLINVKNLLGQGPKEDKLPRDVTIQRKLVDGVPTLVASFSAWETKRTLKLEAPKSDAGFSGLITWLNAKDTDTASVGVAVASIDEEAAKRQLEAATVQAQVANFNTYRVLDTCGKLMMKVGSDEKEYDLYRTMSEEGPVFKAYPALNEFQKAERRRFESLKDAEDC